MFRARCAARGEYLHLAARANGLAHGRLGLAVGRKAAAAAARRNYLKRALREHFRRNATAVAGLDLVAIPRQALSRGEFTAFGTEFLSLVARCRCRACSAS